ncbi:MAG TPA: hypothetical protein VGB13_04165 [Candidatus Krumholzibacteria bacterium]
MLFVFSKVVQLMGMGTVGFGLYLGVSIGEGGMLQELRMLLGGTLIFFAGWLLQRRSQA